MFSSSGMNILRRTVVQFSLNILDTINVSLLEGDPRTYTLPSSVPELNCMRFALINSDSKTAINIYNHIEISPIICCGYFI